VLLLCAGTSPMASCLLKFCLASTQQTFRCTHSKM
jgi:hypothetical protein